MKTIAGFIMGVAAVVMVCWFFIVIPKGDKGSDMAAKPMAELNQSYKIKDAPVQKIIKKASHGDLNQKTPLPEKKAEDASSGTGKKSMPDTSPAGTGQTEQTEQT